MASVRKKKSLELRMLKWELEEIPLKIHDQIKMYPTGYNGEQDKSL